MPLLRFAEYKPDISDYEGSSTKSILNVVPKADGYGPFADFSRLHAKSAGGVPRRVLRFERRRFGDDLRGDGDEALSAQQHKFCLD
jgi:hypothetical protein